MDAFNNSIFILLVSKDDFKKYIKYKNQNILLSINTKNMKIL